MKKKRKKKAGVVCMSYSVIRNVACSTVATGADGARVRLWLGLARWTGHLGARVRGASGRKRKRMQNHETSASRGARDEQFDSVFCKFVLGSIFGFLWVIIYIAVMLQVTAARHHPGRHLGKVKREAKAPLLIGNAPFAVASFRKPIIYSG